MTFMTRELRLAVVTTICSAFLAACSAGVTGSVVSPERQAAIIKGKTTKAEILRDLGNPDQKIDLGGGKEQFSYIRQEWGYGLIRASEKRMEFWIVFKSGVVEDFGDRPTDKVPNYFQSKY
jgi:hypothetical protein